MRLTINNFVIYNIVIEKERGYIMLNIDQAILNTDKVICDNISTLGADNRGLLSQNILSQLRNFVEYIAQKVYAKGSDIDPNDYELKKEAISYIKTNSNYRFLVKFHDLIQKASSHYTIDENGSVRLMLKYYEYLLRVREFLMRTYHLEVLHNLEQFPLDLDPKLSEYYQKINKKIDRPSAKPIYSQYNDRYYIQKIKPFFVDGKIYYEVTYTVANDKISKFDRVIAFTKLEISDNYAVKLTVRSESIDVLGKQVPIQIIDNWEVSIRHCELNNYARIIDPSKTIGTGTIEYGQVMQFLTETRMSLVELVTSDDAYYLWVKTKATQKARTTNFFDILDKSRELISNQQSGSNVIRYLLHKLNNRILKSQYEPIPCNYLSNLRLLPGATPFDKMPFATSLVSHNPRIYDLLECIEIDNRYYEYWWSFWNAEQITKRKLFPLFREVEYFIGQDIFIPYFQKLVDELINHSYREIIADFVKPINMPNWQYRIIKEDELIASCDKKYIAIAEDDSYCYLLKGKRPSNSDNCIMVSYSGLISSHPHKSSKLHHKEWKELRIYYYLLH